MPLFLLLNFFIAKLLGKELWDEWALFNSYLSVMVLFSMFGIKATVKYTAEHNHTPLLPNVLRDAFKLRMVVMVFFGVFIFLISTPLANLIKNPHYAPLFRIAAVLVPIVSLVEHFKGVFNGLHRIKFNFFITATEFLFKLLFAFLLLQFVTNLSSVVYGFIGGVILAALVGGFSFYQYFYKQLEPASERSFVHSLFQYSLPLFFISVGFMIATEIDTMMLGWLSEKSEVGDYGFAKQIVTKLPHISYAIAMGTMPVFAKITAENKSRMRQLFYRIVGINTVVFLFIAAGIILLSRFFILLLLGDDFEGSVLPLQILTVYVLVFSFIVFLNQLLDYQGMARKRAINLQFSLVLNIVLNYLLIPKYGAEGAAFSTSISYLPYLFLNLSDVRKILN